MKEIQKIVVLLTTIFQTACQVEDYTRDAQLANFNGGFEVLEKGYPAGWAFFLLIFIVDEPGTVWIDDVVIEAVSE